MNRSEVVPLLQGDVAKARVSVENEGRRGQLVSVDTEDPEGEVRISCERAILTLNNLPM